MKKIIIVMLTTVLVVSFSSANNAPALRGKPTDKLFLSGRIITGSDLQKQKEDFVRSIARTNNYTDYLPLTAGSDYPLSGTLYSSVGNNSTVLRNYANATTGYLDMYFANTTGSIIMAVDGSSGGYFTGSSAYAALLGTGRNISLQLATNNTVRYTIDGSGDNTWTGGGTFGGNVGIGTTSPSYKLHLKNSDLQLMVQTDGTGSNRALVGFMNSSGDVKGSIGLLSDNTIRIGDASDYRLVIEQGGNVGIGTTTPSEKLSVYGNIRSEKMIVTQSGWPDYVFNPSFKLKPLLEVEQFIKENNHLPGVPSAKEVADKGVDLGATEAILLKKMEEMTLYMIEMKKEIADLKKQLRTSK